MRFPIRCAPVGLILAICVAGPSFAGDVHGRVIVGAQRAAIGGTLGALDVIGADRAGTLGPVLIYVGEAASELPRVTTTDTYVRLRASRMEPPLQAVSVGSSMTFEWSQGLTRVRGESDHGSFTVAVPPTGTLSKLRMDTVGVFVLRAEDTGQTLGQVVVLPHSAFAVSANGTFELPDLPVGRATIVAYVADRGEVSRRVDVPESGHVDLLLTY